MPDLEHGGCMTSDVRSHARRQRGHKTSGANTRVDADTALHQLAQGRHKGLQGWRISVACTQIESVTHRRALGGGHAQILQPTAVEPDALRVLLHIVQSRILRANISNMLPRVEAYCQFKCLI